MTASKKWSAIAPVRYSKKMPVACITDLKTNEPLKKLWKYIWPIAVKTYFTNINIFTKVILKVLLFTFFKRISDLTDPMIDPHSVTSPTDICGSFTQTILINWNNIDKVMNWTLPPNVLITMSGFCLIFLSPF